MSRAQEEIEPHGLIWSPKSKRAGVQLERKKWSLSNVHKALLSILRTGKAGGGGSLSNWQVQEANFKLGKQVICYGLSQSNCSKSNKKQKLAQREDGLSSVRPPPSPLS